MNPAEMAESFFRHFGVEIAGSSIANVITTLLFGGLKPEVAKKVETLVKEGKIDEAKEVIKANFAGFGMADEELLGQDLILILATDQVNLWEFLNVVDWLCNFVGLDDDEVKLRKRFRSGHSKNHSDANRLVKLITLAKLPNHWARSQWFKASGFADPNLFEQANDHLNTFFDGSEEKFAETRAKVRERFGLDTPPAAPPKHPMLKKIWDIINPFH